MHTPTRSSTLRVLVLNGWVGYAPFEKRIRALRDQCSSLDVLGVCRDLELGQQVIAPFEAIGEFEAGNYPQRLPLVVRASRRVRRAARDTDVIYALGFEMGALAVACTRGLQQRPAIIYEIHDIRNAVLGRALSARILRAVERAVIGRINVLVVTSQSYLSEYYEPQLRFRDTPSVVVENKLLSSEMPNRSKIVARRPGRQEGDPLIVGYFGSIRCPEAWALIKDWVRRSKGRVHCIVRGTPRGIPGFHQDISTIDGLSFEGPYRDPEDLAALHADVDVVWAAGNQQKISHPWSRVCRFYNACYFKRPLIVARGTDDGKAVDSFRIGLTIDLEQPQMALDQLTAISDSQLDSWGQALDQLPDSTCTYEDEHRRVLDMCQHGMVA